MKKVVLLGDSIRLAGYGLKVPEMLGSDYQVWQSEDNGQYIKYTLRSIWNWQENIKDADIIHWNNGLWDAMVGLFDDGEPFTKEDEYVDNAIRIAQQLLTITPNVIFATTTPVKPGELFIDNAIISRYNAAIVPKLQAMGVRINDLHSVVAANISEFIGEDKIHLTEAGINACSEQVVRMIKEF